MNTRAVMEQRKGPAQPGAGRVQSCVQTKSTPGRADTMAPGMEATPANSLPSGRQGLAHEFGGLRVFPGQASAAPGSDQQGPGYLAERSVSKPRLAVRSFSLKGDRPDVAVGSASGGRQRPDKSKGPGSESQDQSASLSVLEATTRGVHMEAEATGAYTSADYPDGFKFTQTIDTTVPLGGTTSPYVDPRPNDDAKPFYWTDAEQARYVTKFVDYPSRDAPASGATTWNATLALNGVNESTKTVTAFDALTYGFTRDSAGTVTVLGPASVGFSEHQATLSSEFPSWTFS